MKTSLQAKRAALAIINSTVNPAMRHDATNVTAPRLAEIIEREMKHAELLKTIQSIAEVASHRLKRGVSDNLMAVNELLHDIAGLANIAIAKAEQSA